MKELSESNKIKFDASENVKAVLNYIDHMIAGKRFGEFDSGAQIFLLDCQVKIDEMQHGYYTEESLLFLEGTINNILETMTAARDEIVKARKEISNESNDKSADESVEVMKKLKEKETK